MRKDPFRIFPRVFPHFSQYMALWVPNPVATLNEHKNLSIQYLTKEISLTFESMLFGYSQLKQVQILLRNPYPIGTLTAG